MSDASAWVARAAAYDAELEAAALYHLLGDDVRVVEQLPNADEYPGHPQRIDPAVLASHLSGEKTYAVACSSDSATSYVLGADIDENFAQRTRLLAVEVRKRGLEAASIYTGAPPGDPDDHGKLLIFFRRPLPMADLHRLAQEIRDGARREGWGIERKRVDLRPLTTGYGGLLRIGGRNGARSGPVEVTFSADGEPRSFADIVPSPMSMVPTSGAEPIPKAPLHRFVRAAEMAGLPQKIEHHPQFVKYALRAAHEFVRVFGDSHGGREEFARWFHTTRKNTPRLQTYISTTRSDKRDPFSWEPLGRWAWEKACAERMKRHRYTTSVAPQPEAGCSVTMGHGSCSVTAPEGEAEGSRDTSVASKTESSCSVTTHEGEPEALRDMLQRFVEAKGLQRIGFECGYRDIARFMGLTYAMEACRLVRRAEALGVVVVLDRGSQDSSGRGRGDKTIYAIVLNGEDASEIARKGAEHHSVKRRRAEREEYDAGKAVSDVVIVREFLARSDADPANFLLDRAALSEYMGRPTQRGCSTLVERLMRAKILVPLGGGYHRFVE